MAAQIVGIEKGSTSNFIKGYRPRGQRLVRLRAELIDVFEGFPTSSCRDQQYRHQCDTNLIASHILPQA